MKINAFDKKEERKKEKTREELERNDEKEKIPVRLHRRKHELALVERLAIILIASIKANEPRDNSVETPSTTPGGDLSCRSTALSVVVSRAFTSAPSRFLREEAAGSTVLIRIVTGVKFVP